MPYGLSPAATVHGFRATTSTILNEVGFRPDVIERQLAHAEHNKVRDVYRQNWRLVMDRESAQNACDELVRQGWLREQITPSAFAQKEKMAYLINPKVRAQ